MWTESLILVEGARTICPLVSAQEQVAQQTPVQLPAGEGKEIVQSACTKCHTLERIVNSGYTHDGWQLMVNQMISNGAKLTPENTPILVDYLAKSFPEKPMPSPVLIPGTVQVSIKEWTVPTAGSRPHDPYYAPDGMVWYTGNASNLLGRFDPKTGEFKEYRLKTPRSGPHGLVSDKDGNIWFTAN